MSLRDTPDNVLHSMLQCLGYELSTTEDDEHCRLIYDQRDAIEAEISCRQRAAFTWSCYDCGREFPDHVNGEQPAGPKIVKDDKGWLYIAGNVCGSCAHPSLPSSLPEREQA